MNFLSLFMDVEELRQLARDFCDQEIAREGRKPPNEVERAYMECGILAGLLAANGSLPRE